MKYPPRKRRTREHIIADLSFNHVERHALLAGFVLEQPVHDYGIDLELITFNAKGEVQEGEVLIQLKASDHLTLRRRQATIGCRIDRRDLARWLNEPQPVILILCDGQADLSYWLYVQSHFRRQKDFNLFAAGKTITVHVPNANVVDAAAMHRFSKFRDRVVAQMKEVVHDEG